VCLGLQAMGHRPAFSKTRTLRGAERLECLAISVLGQLKYFVLFYLVKSRVLLTFLLLRVGYLLLEEQQWC